MIWGFNSSSNFGSKANAKFYVELKMGNTLMIVVGGIQCVNNSYNIVRTCRILELVLCYDIPLRRLFGDDGICDLLNINLPIRGSDCDFWIVESTTKILMVGGWYTFEHKLLRALTMRVEDFVYFQLRFFLILLGRFFRDFQSGRRYWGQWLFHLILGRRHGQGDIVSGLEQGF